MTFVDRVAVYLTKENALEYASKTDRWLWVVDNVLDPAGVIATDARIDWIEDRFDELLAVCKS